MLNVSVYGHLCIVESAFDGILTDEQIARGDHGARVVFESRNRITDVGMQVFSRLLGGAVNSAVVGGDPVSDPRDIAVASIEIGKGDTRSPSELDGVFSLALVPTFSVVYPTDTSVQFRGTVPANEINGVTIREEALRLRNGKVFAKLVIDPGHYKAAGTSLMLKHTISFNRA